MNKNRHILPLQTARELIFSIPEYEHGYFEVVSKRTGAGYELYIQKKKVDSGKILMFVSFFERGVRKFVGAYFASKLNTKKLVPEKERQIIQECLRRLEHGDLSKLEKVMEVYHGGRCLVCGRRLKTERAVIAGMGDYCAKKQKDLTEVNT